MKKTFFYLLLLSCNLTFAQQQIIKNINGCGSLINQTNNSLYQNNNQTPFEKFDCFLQTVTDSTNYDFKNVNIVVELQLSKITNNQLFFNFEGKTVVLDYNGTIQNIIIGDKSLLKIQFVKSIGTFYYFKLFNIFSKK